MAKKRVVAVEGLLVGVWGFVAWLTGIIVSLAVGFGLIGGTLEIPWLSDIANGLITRSAGWIVVGLSILGAVLVIIDKLINENGI